MRLYEFILNEDVSPDQVRDAIDNKYYVRINYDDGKENNGNNPKGSRVVAPMAMGLTKAGNPVFRAFQENGNSRKGAPNWKFFRMDRVTSWRPMKKKRFYMPPDESFGKYNVSGDRTMGRFDMNADFGNMEDPLSVERARTASIKDSPKVSTRNANGPISASKQRKNNVYTSQPNSKRYKEYAKNIDAAANDNIDRFDDELWDMASREKQLQDTERILNNSPQPNDVQSGPIQQGQNNDFDEYDVDFNEDDYLNTNNRRNF